MEEIARHPRLHGDQGAVVVEAALFMPILAVFALGLIEFGFAYKQTNIAERTVGTAGRTAATFADHWRSDYEILRAVDTTFAGADDEAQIERVIVWNAKSANEVPPACDALEPSGFGSFGISDVCNVYSPEQIATDSLAGFPRTVAGTPPNKVFDCGAGSWDINWCPTDRDRLRDLNGTDFVGIEVRVRYSTLTGMFTDELTITRSIIFEVDPEAVT